jgi:hypothetical protein
VATTRASSAPTQRGLRSGIVAVVQYRAERVGQVVRALRDVRAQPSQLLCSVDFGSWQSLRPSGAPPVLIARARRSSWLE